MARLSESIITNAATYVVLREMQRSGEIFVDSGDSVTADQVIARTEAVEQNFTLFVTNELGVEADNLKKYLSKSVGADVKQDEVIARMRRGLRSTVVKSPVDGTLIAIDESAGTATISASVGVTELRAMVDGVVESLEPDRGVWIRTSGSRIVGAFALGFEAGGPLVVGVDRPDRELTTDQVNADWKGGIVLAGMTAGVPALNRMREVGVAGVIMGSTTEADARRFARQGAEGQTEDGVLSFWGSPSHPSTLPALQSNPPSMMVLVTEGFGRQPVYEEIFSLLRGHAGEDVAMLNPISHTGRFERPAIYIPGEEMGERVDSVLGDGSPVRLQDPSRPGLVGVCQGDPYLATDSDGVHSIMVDVVLNDGSKRPRTPLSTLDAVE